MRPPEAVVTVLTTALMLVSCSERPLIGAGSPSAALSADSLPCSDVLELSVRQEGISGNKFFIFALEVIFVSPDGAERPVKGFFYGGNTWKTRFRPDQPGRWAYTYTMSDSGGGEASGTGAFECTPSRRKGPVGRHPENPYRWIFADGTPYFPVGLQDCIDAPKGLLAPVMPIDGEDRADKKARQVTVGEYFSIYGQAGFNLFRFSPNNCSYPLFDDLDRYREAESLATDQLLSLAREHGFRVMYGIFGFYQSSARADGILGKVGTNEIVDKEKRFIDYSVARWGVYVDFWQLLNETEASDSWTAEMADYIRSVDPDRKPVTTSWQKPHLPSIDINAPHWYESEDELQSDRRVQQEAANWKRAGKPVIVGEQGNAGMNWDPRSGVRMRIRTWTALFEEIGLVFWNTSWAKNGMHHGVYTPRAPSNIYLGPEERGYIGALRRFATRLDAGVRTAPIDVSEPGRVRAYGLRSDVVAAAYLHHVEDHTAAAAGVQISLDLPAPSGSTAKLLGEWVEPSTGEVVARPIVAPGRQTLDVPPFTVDIALIVTAERPKR